MVYGNAPKMSELYEFETGSFVTFESRQQLAEFLLSHHSVFNSPSQRRRLFMGRYVLVLDLETKHRLTLTPPVKTDYPEGFVMQWVECISPRGEVYRDSSCCRLVRSLAAVYPGMVLGLNGTRMRSFLNARVGYEDSTPIKDYPAPGWSISAWITRPVKDTVRSLYVVDVFDRCVVGVYPDEHSLDKLVGSDMRNYPCVVKDRWICSNRPLDRRGVNKRLSSLASKGYKRVPVVFHVFTDLRDTHPEFSFIMLKDGYAWWARHALSYPSSSTWLKARLDELLEGGEDQGRMFVGDYWLSAEWVTLPQ